jgi:hypothetical protein
MARCPGLPALAPPVGEPHCCRRTTAVWLIGCVDGANLLLR